MSICLVCDFSTVATCPSIPALRFAFCLYFIRFVFVVRSCFSGEPFIAGRLKVALLFWFFGDFRCVVIHCYSWVRAGTELRQFLRVFLPTLLNVKNFLLQ